MSARWLARRLLTLVPTLLGITLVTFFLSRLAPGSPLGESLGVEDGKGLTREQLATTERLLGLDRPWLVQYGDWIGRSLRFDFGDSLMADHRPVREKIGEALAVSASLQSIAVMLMYAIGLPLGLFGAAWSGRRGERWLDQALFLLGALPLLFLGALLIALCCTGEHAWFPLAGLMTPQLSGATGWIWFRDRCHHAVLPIACLVLSGFPGIARYARAGVAEALAQPFVTALRARGLSERRILWRHALRNGLVPTVTLFANVFPWIVGGSVAVETLFSIPGLGRLATQSILARDYPVVMALSVLVGAATLVGFLVSDLALMAIRRRSAA